MDLISDLELGSKDASEIHLAIVWDDTLDPGVQNYQYLEPGKQYLRPHYSERSRQGFAAGGIWS